MAKQPSKTTDAKESAPAQKSSKPANAEATGKSEGPRVSFESSDLKSSYCNVCNATSTREEVVLNFGINENWDRNVGDMMVKLQHRIIVNPHAAKRLLDLLQKLIKEHESRYGELK
jgi:hypothetical protein